MITDHYHYYHAGGECYHNQFDSWEFSADRKATYGDWPGRCTQTSDLPRAQSPCLLGQPTLYGHRARRVTLTPQCFMRAINFSKTTTAPIIGTYTQSALTHTNPLPAPKIPRPLQRHVGRQRLHFDWPDYAPVDPTVEDKAALAHIRACYAGTLTMADVWLGKLLDTMDALDLWKDTTVVLSTDHGHLLGEHGYWAKNYVFDYKEKLVHMPMVVCAPDAKPRRVQALTSTIDLMPTFMELHGEGHRRTCRSLAVPPLWS